MNQEPHSHISIKGSDLVSAYGVYLVLIKDQDKNYCYVGQTGDAKYISARSPFYRLAAHLSYGKSTQNQVYEGLKKALELQSGELRKEREDLEKWLQDKTIDIHFFKTDDFMFLSETDENKETHKNKRRRTLELETALIIELKKNSTITLMNKTEVSYKEYKIALPKAKEIIKSLGL
jgi:hypothetical protein